MHFPRFLRRVNRIITNPLLGSVGWLVPPLAIVHHVGRRSGKRYRTPVVAFRATAGFVIPLTYGRDVDWARNLLAAGGGDVVQMGRSWRLQHPRIVDGEAARPWLPAGIGTVLIAAALPGFVLLDFEPG